MTKLWSKKVYENKETEVYMMKKIQSNSSEELLAFVLKNFKDIMCNQYNNNYTWKHISEEFFEDIENYAAYRRTIRWSKGTVPRLENLKLYIEYMDRFDDVKEYMRKLEEKYPGVDIKVEYEKYLKNFLGLPDEDIRGIVKYYREIGGAYNEVAILLLKFVLQNIVEILKYQHSKVGNTWKKIAQNYFGEQGFERTLNRIVNGKSPSIKSWKRYLDNWVNSQDDKFEERTFAMVLDYMVELQKEYPDTDIKEAFCAYVKKLLSFSDTEIRIIIDYYRCIK